MEAAAIRDGDFLLARHDDSVLYFVVDKGYSLWVLPWAAGLAFGALGALLMKRRPGKW